MIVALNCPVLGDVALSCGVVLVVSPLRYAAVSADQSVALPTLLSSVLRGGRVEC